MKVKLGRLLSDMVLYGDIHEHPWPVDWPEKWQETTDKESETRLALAATLVGLANGEAAGSVVGYDALLKELLNQEIELDEEFVEHTRLVPAEKEVPRYDPKDF